MQNREAVDASICMGGNTQTGNTSGKLVAVAAFVAAFGELGGWGM